MAEKAPGMSKPVDASSPAPRRGVGRAALAAALIVVVAVAAASGYAYSQYQTGQSRQGTGLAGCMAVSSLPVIPVSGIPWFAVGISYTGEWVAVVTVYDGGLSIFSGCYSDSGPGYLDYQSPTLSSRASIEVTAIKLDGGNGTMAVASNGVRGVTSAPYGSVSVSAPVSTGSQASGSTTASTSQIEITGAYLLVANDGSATYSVAFKNSGTEPVTAVDRLTIGGDSIMNWLATVPSDSAPLAPGTNDSAGGIIAAPSGFAVGDSYPVLLVVTFSDGSSVSVSSSVVAASYSGSGTASKTSQVQITAVSFAKSSSGYVFTIQLKNSGGTPLAVGSNINSDILLNGHNLIGGAFASTVTPIINPSSVVNGFLNPGDSMVVTVSGAAASGFAPAIGDPVSISAVLGSATAQTSVVVTS